MGHRLIEIDPPDEGDRRLTVYIKGFLARGEEPGRFRDWQVCHQRLARERDWGPGATGVAWDSGEIGGWPWPVLSAAKTVWDWTRVARRAGRASPLGALGWFAAEHLVRVSARFIVQYRGAIRAAREEADPLAEALERLGRQYPELRVVSHSLGCLLAIEALGRLDPSARPAEVHLCAPACREDEVADRLAGLGRRGAFLYHARNDLVLETAFLAMSRGRALGAVGPTRDHPGLEVVDVSEHFGFWVHHEYKRRFADFARDTGSSAVPGEAGESPRGRGVGPVDAGG
jgi:hypothetical protein